MALHTNADLSVTPKQRAEREKNERQDALIQDAVDKSAKAGPSIDMLTGDDQQYSTTFDRFAEQKSYATGDKPTLIPIAIRVGPQYPGGFHYVLSDADYDAVAAGYYCGYCLDRLPEIWAPACALCGADRDLVN